MRSNKKTIYEALGRNPVHPFPARMAPGIALDFLAHTKRKLRVFDPMMGSGTVLAVARSQGHHAIGLDIDPLAILISKVWTKSVRPVVVRRKAAEVLERAQIVFKRVPSGEAYPKGTDSETQDFLRYWFDSYARRQLAALASCIRRVQNEAVRNVLWCGFSRLIITKQSGASLAMDLAHSRPHKSYKYAPIKPFKKFLAAVDRVVENCIQGPTQGRGPATSIYEGDARNVPLRNASVDLVLTSPPYLNAIDYMRCSKFSLVWMGYNISKLRGLRAKSVGAEVGKSAEESDKAVGKILASLDLRPKLSQRHAAILRRYILDIQLTVAEVARVLVPGGKAVYVIGENTIRRTFVRNSRIISAVAQLAGLKLQTEHVRVLPSNRRYLPPPSRRLHKKSLRTGSHAALHTRMRREAILTFRKPAIGLI